MLASMLITRFSNLKSPIGRTEEVDIHTFLSSPVYCDGSLAAKKSLPLFSFTRFRDNYRSRDSVESTEVLGFDVDVEVVHAEQLEEVMDALGIFAFWHSSPSATEEEPRWHLFVPTSRPLTDEEHDVVHANLRAAFPFNVGTAAVDPSRAWFVPARGKFYSFGFSNSEKPLIVEAWLAQRAPKKTTATTESDGHLSPPSDEQHEKLIDHLYAHWPPIGRRQEAHLALAGALVKAGYTRQYIRTVLHDLTIATGNDEVKAKERERLVDRTYDKFKADSPITAWQKLSEVIGGVPTSTIHSVLGMDKLGGFDELVVGEKKDEYPEKNPDHVYTHQFGRIAAASEARKCSVAEVSATLSDHPDWHKVLWYNEISARVQAFNPPLKLDAEDANMGLTESDGMRIRAWFESVGLKMGLNEIYATAVAVAKERPFHPIRAYLNRCPNKKGSIKALCTKALHLSEHDVVSRAMVQKQLVAAVRRARRPGTKVDSVLVFLSKAQGRHKTLFIDTMFGEDYVKTNVSDIRSKDAMQDLQGMWAIEFGELTSVASWDLDALKEYLTRRIDIYRPPYGRDKIAVPRSCVFFGTTNQPDFLRDPTGNRRFWIINLENRIIDIEWVKEHRDEVWGEAAAIAETDEPHWFSADDVSIDERNAEYEESDEWFDPIREHVLQHVPGTELKMLDVYRHVVHQGDHAAIAKVDQALQRRVVRLMRKIGCEKKKKASGVVWVVPELEGNRATVVGGKSETVRKLLEKVNK